MGKEGKRLSYYKIKKCECGGTMKVIIVLESMPPIFVFKCKDCGKQERISSKDYDKI